MTLEARAWPVLSGTVPFLAEGFTRRPETGEGLPDAVRPGVTVVLGADGDHRAPAAYRGGTGKTQLAAALASRMWAGAELDLLAWVNASSRDHLVSGYARALADIRVAAPPGNPEAAASVFLTWLGDTSRRWLVVLDGLADAADADGLWPQGPTGSALVTTQLARLSPSLAVRGRAERGIASQVPQQLSIALPSFSQREALQYLSARLTDDPYQAGGALDLAANLDCLPAGLELAVAYLLDSGQDCRQYRLAYDQYRKDWVAGIAGDPLAPSWMLAVDRAREFAPTDLPWPAVKLAAVLGPAGIPGAVLTSSAACAYVTGRQSVTDGDQASLRAAFGNLQRTGLVAIEPDDEVRTVVMAGALQSSIQRFMGPAELRRAVQAAADAVSEAWRDSGHRAGMEQALRDCTTSMRRCDQLALWDQGCHPVLIRAGQSLEDAQMAETALAYWHDVAGLAAKQHGKGSPLTFQLRERLASAATAAGHADEAISLREELAADIDEVAGPASPQAITARASLAAAFRSAGRLSDAILLGTRVASDSSSVFGPVHAQTKHVLSELGSAYYDAARYREAIDVLQRCLSLHTQTVGMMHPETVSMRKQLAEAYRRAGRGNDAIRIYQDALAQVENAMGAGQPDTITAREGLALAYYHAGRTGEAASTLEKCLAEWRRVPGSGAASTVPARTNLAAIYALSGRAKDAIPLYKSLLADLERVRGPAHADSFRARRNLAAVYHKARRLPEAVETGETTLTDCEPVLGLGHRETLTVRANLAHTYHATGRLKRASAYFDRALRDCERALGPDDALTSEVRALRQRYLSGRQGFAPIISLPDEDPDRPRPVSAPTATPSAHRKSRLSAVP
jgi:tetratricopeptide (TPR) repeat protein